jgi:undecaprenyl-diphosphatase
LPDGLPKVELPEHLTVVRKGRCARLKEGSRTFLPVSSSGHLLLSQYFIEMDQERIGLSFDAAIHTGTLLAAVLFFRRVLLAMALAFLGSLPPGLR